jgi:predicted lipoprotein with Yx(FWY)xxD motif
MKIRIGWNRGARVAPLAIAALVLAAACSSTAAGGAASTAATGAAAPAAAATPGAASVAGGGAYGGGAGTYGGGAAPATAPAAASAAAGVYDVKTATDAKAGTFLTGEDGKTLYIFTKDAPGTSACAGDCAATWPPFILASGESVKAGSGVAGTLATITRADGSAQVTYNGQPLYYFAADQKAGDVNGQGVGGVWFAAKP